MECMPGMHGMDGSEKGTKAALTCQGFSLEPFPVDSVSLLFYDTVRNTL